MNDQRRDDTDPLLGTLRGAARDERAADEAAWAEAQAAGVARLGPADHDRMAEAVLGRLAPPRAQRREGDIVALETRRRRPAMMVAFVLGPLAAAAAVVIAPRLMFHDPPGLPMYAVTASGGVQGMRGGEPAASTAPVVLLPESQLNVVVRPEVAVAGPVAAKAFLWRQGAIEEVSPVIEIAPTGAVAVRAATATVFGARRGAYELRVVVGRPELERALHVLAGTGTTAGPGWQRLTVPIELR